MKLQSEQIQKELETLVEEGKKSLTPKVTLKSYIGISELATVSFEKYTPWWSKARNFLSLFLTPENTFLSQFRFASEELFL